MDKISEFIYYTNLYEDTGLQSIEEISEFLTKNKKFTNLNKRETETLNLYLATKYVLDNLNELTFDPIIIDEINKIVLGTEESNLRSYTKTNVSFLGSVPWDEAEKHLQYICDLYYKKLNSGVSLNELGAWFFWIFLYIHVFRDGNGRTARLLLCLHFKRLFPLITPKLLREEYIDIFSGKTEININDYNTEKNKKILELINDE